MMNGFDFIPFFQKIQTEGAFPVICLVSALISMFLVAYSIPGIILVAFRKRLLDRPHGRKKHLRVTSNFGGLAIYSAVVFMVSILNIGHVLPEWNYIFAASFMLFITGLKDDVIAITFRQKFIVQFIASFVVSYLGGIRLENLYGFMGIYQLPEWISILLTMVCITFITNAYNLIDGVDGLCGVLSFIGFFAFGVYFLGYNAGLSIVSFTFCGAILGFLYYNISPARIFMGDTGSLVIGFFLAIMSVSMVQHPAPSQVGDMYLQQANIALALVICIVPVFDTFRVFLTRILHKQHPFTPDRRHIHHLLSDAGLSPNRLDAILAMLDIIFIGMVAGLVKLRMPIFSILGLLLIIILLLMIFVLRLRNKAMSARALKASQKGAKTPDSHEKKWVSLP